MNKIFIDTEFTGLRKDTDLISIGLTNLKNATFYAEFTDYDKSKIDEWINTNVINNLILNTFTIEDYKPFDKNVRIKGTKQEIKIALEHWLNLQGDIEIWSDCLAYDWVLFCDMFGGALNIPKNVYYIPFDICTTFKDQGIDPDINREEFAFSEIKDPTYIIDLAHDRKKLKHNALWDAIVIKHCYLKLYK